MSVYIVATFSPERYEDDIPPSRPKVSALDYFVEMYWPHYDAAVVSNKKHIPGVSGTLTLGRRGVAAYLVDGTDTAKLVWYCKPGKLNGRWVDD